MKLHSATVCDRTLEVDDRRLVQGTANADAIAIAFDGEWDGLDVRVIFTSTTGEQFMPAAREDGAYVVPSEVTARVGQVYVTAIGTRDSVVVANALMRKPLLVEPRVMADTAPAPSDPSQSEYEKVWADCKSMLSSIDFSLGDDGHGYVTYESGDNR